MPESPTRRRENPFSDPRASSSSGPPPVSYETPKRSFSYTNGSSAPFTLRPAKPESAAAVGAAVDESHGHSGGYSHFGGSNSSNQHQQSSNDQEFGFLGPLRESLQSLSEGQDSAFPRTPSVVGEGARRVSVGRNATFGSEEGWPCATTPVIGPFGTPLGRRAAHEARVSSIGGVALDEVESTPTGNYRRFFKSILRFSSSTSMFMFTFTFLRSTPFYV